MIFLLPEIGNNNKPTTPQDRCGTQPRNQVRSSNQVGAWQEHSSYECTARETNGNLPVCWQKPVSSSSQEEKRACQNAHGLNPLRQASLSMRLGHSTTHETKSKQAGRSQQHKSHNNKTHLWLVTKHIYSQWHPYAEQVDFYLQHHNQSTIWMPLGIVCFRSHQTEIKSLCAWQKSNHCQF